MKLTHLDHELHELRKEFDKLKQNVEAIPGWFMKPEKRIDAVEERLAAIEKKSAS